MYNYCLEARKFNWFVNLILVLMQSYGWPGKHRVYLWLCQYYPNKLISHNVNHQPFLVPIDEWCFWLEKGPSNYYLKEFIPFFNIINQTRRSVTFFDLGADIGTVSAIANKYCDNLSQICAFEPNPKSFSLLSENLRSISHNSWCQNMAVSDFIGNVHFSASETNSTDHEGSIDTKKEGNTKVVTIDHWLNDNEINICEDVVIKIDVEGQEQQTIIGAKKLIKAARSVVVLLEIHPSVLKATQTTPEQLFETLEGIRSVKWIVPALENCSIDREVDFFTQFPTKQYDVIGILD